MKMLVTMNQIAYFKPETTARRLKEYYYQGEGNPVIFLGYLRLIRLLPQLGQRAQPLQPALYRDEVRGIYLDTSWETTDNGWLLLFLREFREFFTGAEWLWLQRRCQRLHPFLDYLVADYFRVISNKRTLIQLSIVLLKRNSPQKNTLKLIC